MPPPLHESYMGTTPFLPLQLGSAKAAPVGALAGCARETLETVLDSAASRLGEYAAPDAGDAVAQAFELLRRDFVAPLHASPSPDQEFLSPVQLRRVAALRATLEAARGRDRQEQDREVVAIVRAITRLTVFTNVGEGTPQEYRRGRDVMALFVLGISMAFANAAGDARADLTALYEEYAADLPDERVAHTLRMRGRDRDDYWARVKGIARIDLNKEGGRIIAIPEDRRGSCFYASVAESLAAADRPGWDSEAVRQYLAFWIREHGSTHRFEMGLTIAEMLLAEDNPNIRTVEGLVAMILSPGGFFGGHIELLAATEAFDADIYVYERVVGEPRVLRRLEIGRSVLGQCVAKSIALHLVFRKPVGSAQVHLNSVAHWDVYLPPTPRTASPPPVPIPTTPAPPAAAPARPNRATEPFRFPGTPAPAAPSSDPFRFSLAPQPTPAPSGPGIFSFPAPARPPASLADQQRATLAAAAERRHAKSRKPTRR